MGYLKFDLAKLERLNDPGRFETLDPELMWRALGEPDPKTIVEVGAGTGLFAAKFVELAPQATVYAADIEPTMVEWMRANREQVAVGRLLPVLAEESFVPLPDGVADLVVMINLHHELVDKEASYAEALRLLRPAGQLLVADWAPVETPKGPPLAVRSSVADVVATIEGAGFAEVRSHSGLPYAWLVTGSRP